MTDKGIRLNDWFIFHQAARQFGVWILVRWTNPQSLKYIGRRSWDPRSNRKLDYIPKPIDCKPKTAKHDVGKYELAGLVIDPTKHPASVMGGESKYESAKGSWDKFLKGCGVKDAADLNRKSLASPTTVLDEPSMKQTMHIEKSRAGVNQQDLKQAISKPFNAGGAGRMFRVDLDESSRHYGCLMLNGAYLHGDYDLKDIIDPRRIGPNTAVSEKLHGQLHMRADELEPIQVFINTRIGVPMIQHGGEAQYAPHTEDTVEVFGPSGQAATLEGKDEIARWYKYGFNRETIDPGAKKKQTGEYLAPPSKVHVSTSKGGVILLGADTRS